MRGKPPKGTRGFIAGERRQVRRVVAKCIEIYITYSVMFL